MALLLTAVKLIVGLGLFGLMFAQGLGVTKADFGYLRRHPRLAAWSVVAVLLLVPLATLVVIGLVRPDPPTTVLLAILAASPAAPFALPSALKAGRREFVVALHLLLAVLSVVSVPLVLAGMAAALEFAAAVRATDIFRQVALGFLLPLLLGIGLRAWRPALAQRLEAPLGKLSGLLLAVAVVMVFALSWRLLFQLDLRSYMAMALTVVAALAIGHGLITTDPGERVPLALECATRHPGLVLLIATQNFPQSRPAAVLLPYLLVFLLLSTLYKQVVKRQRRRRAGTL